MGTKKSKEPKVEQQAQRVFFWRPGTQFKIDPMVAAEELKRIIESNDNRVDANRIVEEAENPLNPLHEEFEWDDSVAAQEHRLWQARHLTGSLQFRQLTSNNREITGRMFVQISKPEGGQRKDYTLTTYALSQEDLRAEVLRTALLELAAFRRKYADLSELALVIRVIDTVEKKLKKGMG
jgi:hypothetical protein